MTLKSSIGMIHFHCWWRSDAESHIWLVLLRQHAEMLRVRLSLEAPIDWQLFQRVLDSDEDIVQDAREGDVIQVQYQAAGTMDVRECILSTSSTFIYDSSCARLPAGHRPAPGISLSTS